MKLAKSLTVIIAIFFTWSGIYAQENQLLLEVTHLGGDMTLKWYPLNPEFWESGNIVGYNLDRYDLDENGSPRKDTRTRLNEQPIMPRDSVWFNEQGDADGYIAIIGKLLYDTAFQVQAEVLDSRAMRYNYLIYEAQLSDNIAADLLGLSFNDTTYVDGLLYQYELSSAHAGLEKAIAGITMDVESGVWLSDELELDIELPNGLSLTDMSGRLREQPFDQIGIVAKAYGDSIVLRWGPNHALLWEEANRHGYVLIKAVMRPDEIKMDTLAWVRPWAQEELGDFILQQDSIALVAAQVLYGGLPTPPQNLYEQSNLLENRFGFALYAAERSRLAGDILGLRYVDKEVIEGETYTYLISTPASNMPTSTNYEEIENVYVLDPPPVNFIAREADGVIYLRWDKTENNRLFSAYHVRRSEDGGNTFHRLNKNPIVFLEDERAPLESFGFVDSVENNKPFVYQLVGLTPFAEESLPAEVKAMARDLTPPPSPQIYHTELLDDTITMVIKWKMDTIVEDLSGYHVLMGEGNVGYFDTLITLLPTDTLIYRYKVENGTDRTHFFKVLAFDESGNISESDARYIHYPDLIPPEPPSNLDAEVNKEGIVTLVWDHSISNDVTGYWVYYTHAPSELLVPAHGQALVSNIFRDTLPMKTLNKKIYYVVRSQDDNFNRSEYSDMLELARPDIVPPQPPFLKEPMGFDSMLVIAWMPSISDDVQYYELEKRLIEEGNEWQLFQTIAVDSTMGYIDTEVKYNSAYEYRVRAKDFSDNYSEYSTALSGKLVFDAKKIQVSNFQTFYDETIKSVRLSWNYVLPARLPQEMHSYEFYLFKSYGAEEVQRFEKVDGNTLFFQDENIETGALHNYAVMVVYNTGASSPLSEIKSVLIE